MKVQELMSSAVTTAHPDTPFPQLIDDLIENDISGLPVVDDEDRLVGIVTEADLVSKDAYGGQRRRLLEFLADVVSGGRSKWAVKSKGRTAAEVMSKPVVTAFPNEDVRRAARRMVEAGVKRLPIIDEDQRLVGIVSRADIIRIMHRSDEELARDAAALLADPIRAPEDHAVKAEVTDGVVTLTGTVRYPVDLAMVTRLIWRLPAVVDVDNQCTAREADPRLDTYLSPPI